MSYINPPSDEILEVIRKHFAKEYGIQIDQIQTQLNLIKMMMVIQNTI